MQLLLASWRQKSSRVYDSLFGKWVSWRSEQDSDPVSPPIGEVINFLEHLFEQGYQSTHTDTRWLLGRSTPDGV